MPVNFRSKLPYVTSHVFSHMTALANQFGAINLSQGFPNFEPDERLKALVTQCLAENTSQYSPMPGLLLLREAIAQKVYKTMNVGVNPETEVTIGCGATEMLFDTIAAFVWPGDEVIIIEPGYDCYRPAIDTVGGKVVVYKMKAPDFRIDWEAFAGCITQKTRMIVISTPNNPTGSLMTKEDMEQLSRLVVGTDIIILSDEVYEHMVFDGRAHESPLKYPELRERTVSVFSFGKTLHITGWKVGYAVAPPDLTAEIRRVHQNSVYSVSHPLQKAIALYLNETTDYLGLPHFFEKKRDLFLKAMSATRLRSLPCQGSYFQLFDYSGISSEDDVTFCERMVRDFGVAAIPVSKLHSDGHDDKLVRFCFAKTDDLLIGAGERLKML